MSEERVTDRDLKLNALSAAVTLAGYMKERQLNVVDTAEAIHKWLVSDGNKGMRPAHPLVNCIGCRFTRM